MELGFQVVEERFTYSQFPARFGPLVCASIFALGVLFAGHMASRHGMPLVGIGVLFLTMIAVGAVGGTLLKRILTLPWMRSTASNLVALRQTAHDEPKIWLVAHTDSKSQTIGMLTRVGSIAIASLFNTFFAASMAVQAIGSPEAIGLPPALFAYQSAMMSLLTAFAVLPVALCFITNKSPGALDNATGVAAVLLAAEQIDASKNIGVLLTSAEEIGLAGARYFVSHRRAKGVAINCDTIDNAGRFICMTSNKRRSDAVAIERAGAAVGVNVRIRGMIRGILTDSVPFGEAGWSSSTLSRGNLGTLGRVHTSRDEPGRIDGAGVAMAARILAATVEEMS